MMIPVPPNPSFPFSIFSRGSTSIQGTFALVGAGLLLLTVLPTAGSVAGSSVPLPETPSEGSVPPPTHSLREGTNTTGTVVGLLWARVLGTPAYDEARSVATDSSGEYVAGSTQGTLAGQMSAGGADAFLRKYEVAGTEIWTRQFGTSGAEGAYAVAANGSAVYVAGITNGTLPGQTNAGDVDAFVREYDTAGTLLWTRQFGTPAGDFALAAAADASGVYIAGYTDGTFPGQTNAGGAFVRKYDAAGTEGWTRQFNASGGSTYGWAVASDGSSVYVAGQTDGTLPGQSSAGTWDAFVRKYDASGAELWTRQFGTSSFELTWAVAADPSGVYVAGTTAGALPGQTNAGAWDAFVRKYNTSGTESWTREFGTGGIDDAYAAAGDGSGVIVAGEAGGTIPGSLTSGQVFVRRYDLSGTEAWTRQFGTSGSTEAHGVAGNTTGFYVAGRTDGTFPGETNAGGFDAFLCGFGDATLPHSPSIVQAAPGDGTIALAWNPPTLDGGTPITNYTIYRGTSSGALTLFTTVGDLTAHTDNTVTNGVRYYYQVSAVNAVGEGPRSNEVSSTPTGPPSAPRSLQASAGDGTVVLTWQVPTSDGGWPTTNYRIYRGVSSGALSVLTSAAGDVLSYTDAGVTNRVTYYYQVAAANAAGEGPRSVEVSVTPVRPDTVPPTVGITFPQNGGSLQSTTVTLTGTASDDVAVAKVEVSLDRTMWVVAGGTTSWTATLTLREGPNMITVRATDTSGNVATATVTVSVTGGGASLLLFGLVAGGFVIAAVVAAISILRRRKRGGAQPPA